MNFRFIKMKKENTMKRRKVQVSEWKEKFATQISTKELIQNKAYEKVLNLIHYYGHTH